MDYENFVAHSEQCKKVWKEFKDSFVEEELKEFFKHSYAVLSYPRGQIKLGGSDFRTVALESPGFFVPNQASASLLKHIRELEELKKDSGEQSKKERARIEKWFEEFNPQRLKLEESRLEVRFPSLKMALIQRIKQSPLVDQHFTGSERASIRVVLLIP